MNPVSLLKKLSNIKDFISTAEQNYQSDEEVLLKLKITKKLVDKILINLAFDLQKRLNPLEQEPISKIDFDEQVKMASEHLGFLCDQSLNDSLEEIAAFFDDYEGNISDIFSSKNSELLSLIMKESSLIISERFY